MAEFVRAGLPQVSLKVAESEYKALLNNINRDNVPEAERAYLQKSLSHVRQYYDAAARQREPRQNRGYRRDNDDER